MTAETQALADFLLARIAEDEAAVDVAGHFGDPRTNGWADSDAPLQRLDYDQMLTGPSRVLAECEAHRRIVELALAAADADDAYDDDYADGWRCAWESACELLASTYADHPDYRQEWRP